MARIRLSNPAKPHAQRCLNAHLWVLFFCLPTACVPSRHACERAYGPCGPLDTLTQTRIHYVQLPGTRVRDTLPVVQLLRDTARMVTVRYDSTGRLALRYWRDAYGRLQAECALKPDSLPVREITLTRVRTLAAPPAPKPRYGWVIWLVAGAFGLGLVGPTLVRLLWRGALQGSGWGMVTQLLR